MIYHTPGELTTYFVSSLNGKYSLVSTKSKGAITDTIEYHIVGMPEDYELWHIGISKTRDIYPEAVDSGELSGLFLVKAKEKKACMKLFEVRKSGLELDWHITREIEMPDVIKDIVVFPYKSCFIPGQNGKVVLSFRDKKSRNRMIIIN